MRSAGAWKARFVAPTPFRVFYERGDLPLCVEHGAKRRIYWKVDVQKLEDFLQTRAGEKQGIIPDLLFDDVEFFELKGIRSDGSHSNYNGAAVTGVEKRAAAAAERRQLGASAAVVRRPRLDAAVQDDEPG